MNKSWLFSRAGRRVGGSTPSASVNETVALTHSQSESAAFSRSRTEIVTTTDSQSKSVNYGTAKLRAELLMLIDAVGSSISHVFNKALAEAVTLAHAQSSSVSQTGQAPITSVAYEQATPFEISINVPLNRSVAANTTVRALYRPVGAVSYQDAGFLYHMRSWQSGAVQPYFAGWILGLSPGLSYDVRLDITEPGVGSWQVFSGGTPAVTRALPVEGKAVTKTVTAGSSSSFTSTLAGAVAGDVIYVPAGTYSLSGFSWTSPGTSANPVVIRGAGIGQTILSSSSDQVLTLNGNHSVWEDMTVRGASTVMSNEGLKKAVVHGTGTPTNWTYRRIRFDQVDQGIKVWSVHSIGLLVYQCQFVGNGLHSMLTEANDVSGAPQNQWNNTGVHMPGEGNCVWNCTFQGWGDTVKLGYAPGGVSVWDTRACYVHHNYVKWGGDDGIEFDEASGNCCFYNNVVMNTATAASGDCSGDARGLYGPHGLIRNIFVNQMRHPLKFNGVSSGWRLFNNTFIATNKKSGHNNGFTNASATNYDTVYKNNILVYRGSGEISSWSNSPSGDIQSDYNAWFGAGTQGIQFIGNYGSNLANYKSANAGSGIAQHDVATTTNPWVTTVTMGADWTTQVTGPMQLFLSAGAAKNAGTPIPGVTDGYTGAAPDMGALIEGVSMGNIGCDLDPAEVRPTWVTAVSVNTWGSIATSISSIDPNPPANTLWDHGSAYGKVDAWNSMAGDELRSILYQVAGGGHHDYSGNEADELALWRQSPAWRELRAPTINTTPDVQYYGDGRPTSRHQYYGLQCDPWSRRVLLAGGDWYGSTGFFIQGFDSFDILANDYSGMPAGANTAHPPMPASVYRYESKSTAIDPRTGDVHVLGGPDQSTQGNYAKWTAATNAWGAVIGGLSWYREGGCAYDAKRNVIYNIESNGATVYEFNPANSMARTSRALSGSVQGAANFSGGCAVYVDFNDSIYWMSGVTTGRVDRISLPGFTATNLGNTGAGSMPGWANGPWNRWRYFPHLGVIAGVPAYAGNFWFFRVR